MDVGASSLPKGWRRRGVPAEPTRFVTADIDVQVAQALARKLTRIAYLSGAELSAAMRGVAGNPFGVGSSSRGGSGGGNRARAIAATASAFPPDFFKFLRDSDNEDDVD